MQQLVFMSYMNRWKTCGSYSVGVKGGEGKMRKG